MNSQSFDYIIVGAGSAGCILANRLSADTSKTVLLVEAGGSDNSIFIKMPTALSYPMNTNKYNWGYESDAESHLNDRKLDCPRGRVLGGSSSINGMVYVRGHACDFDEWEEAGATGWNYQSCLPYFQRNETWFGGGDKFRGDEGPVATCNGNNMRLNPLYQAFIRAGQEAGYPHTQDYNGYQQEGFGPMHMTVKGGQRSSTATAYLHPILNRSNLTLQSHTQVTKVLFDGRTATGIQFVRGNTIGKAMAKKEVILSAGAIGSPTLLHLSGIGPSPVLQSAGINVVHDLPGVGLNLQDHLEVYLQYRCKQPITLNGSLGNFSKAIIGAKWILFKQGLGASNHFESCAFIRSRAGVKWPDIQYHFLPAAMRYDGRAAFEGHGFQVHVGPTKSKSTGRVQIVSADYNVKPSIKFNYLEKDEDKQMWRTSVALTREIFAQPAMDEFKGEEIKPGDQCQSDADIDAWVRDNVESAYHPCGTCKMGSDSDPMAVLDSDCNVRGTQRLRVVDSSVFPTITNGNLNAPTMMVGEKVADVILGKHPLQPADVSPWIDDDWKNRQRPNSPARTTS